METKKAVSYAEAEIFIFMIDGAILGILTSDSVEEQTKLLDYFLVRLTKLIELKNQYFRMN